MKNVFEVFLVAPYLKECAHRSNSDIGRGYLVYCSVEILAPNKERGNAFCLIVTGIELGLLCKENTYLVCNRKYHCTADIFTMKMLWLKLALESLKKLLQLWTQAWWSLYMRAEPWSYGYGIRLTFWRSWVRILVPCTGWTWRFFTLICCKNCIVCLKRPKINEKEAGVGPFF